MITVTCGYLGADWVLSGLFPVSEPVQFHFQQHFFATNFKCFHVISMGNAHSGSDTEEDSNVRNVCKLLALHFSQF